MKGILIINGLNNLNNNVSYISVIMKRRVIRSYSCCINRLLMKLKRLICVIFVWVKIT
jgi:hypothetical protein